MLHWTPCLGIIILVLVGSAVASDVPFIFDKNIPSIVGYTSSQLEHAHLSSPALVGVPTVTTASGNATLKFPVVGASAGGVSNPQGTTSRKVDDLRNLFDSRVEPENSRVHSLAINIAGDHPGDCTIDQIDDIFGYLVGGDTHKKGWSYIGPPRGVNNFFYANQTITQSDSKDYVGAGDCGDFAVLMSALVESIGGTTRIIMASNNTTGGHAYTQVYLGREDVQNSETEDIIKYLQDEFDTNTIFANVDTDTKDIWLNLDWWPDQNGSPHPGGPIFTGESDLVIYIRENYPTNPLKFAEKANKPPKLISLVPDSSSPQGAGSTISWTAKAKDPERDPILYRFFLNDNPVTKWTKDSNWAWSTDDTDVGANTIEVQIRDGKHALANGFDDRTSFGFNITMQESSSTHKENASGSTQNASSAVLLLSQGSLKGIWAVTGILPEQITMALSQDYNGYISGEAKYEPQGDRSWNAIATGSITKGEVHIVLKNNKSSENEFPITLDGMYRDDTGTITGTFLEGSGSQISKRGEFTAILVNPEISDYMPALANENQ